MKVGGAKVSCDPRSELGIDGVSYAFDGLVVSDMRLDEGWRG